MTDDATFVTGALRGDFSGSLGWSLEGFALDGERKAAKITFVFEYFPGDEDIAASDVNLGGDGASVGFDFTAEGGERTAAVIACALGDTLVNSGSTSGDGERIATVISGVDKSGNVSFGGGGASMGFDSTAGGGERIAAMIARFLASDPTFFRGESEAVVGFCGVTSVRIDSTVVGAGFISGSKRSVDSAFVFGKDASMAAGGGASSLGTDDGSNCSVRDASASAGNPNCLVGNAGDPSSLTFLTFIAFSIGPLSASTSMTIVG